MVIGHGSCSWASVHGPHPLSVAPTTMWTPSLDFGSDSGVSVVSTKKANPDGVRVRVQRSSSIHLCGSSPILISPLDVEILCQGPRHISDLAVLYSVFRIQLADRHAEWINITPMQGLWYTYVLSVVFLSSDDLFSAALCDLQGSEVNWVSSSPRPCVKSGP